MSFSHDYLYYFQIRAKSFYEQALFFLFVIDMFFTVLVGTHPCKFVEDLGKIGLGRKPNAGSDLGDGIICFRQQIPGLLKPSVDQIIDGRHSQVSAEGVGQIKLADVGGFCQGVKGDIPGIVGIQIAFDDGAFPWHPQAV